MKKSPDTDAAITRSGPAGVSSSAPPTANVASCRIPGAARNHSTMSAVGGAPTPLKRTISSGAGKGNGRSTRASISAYIVALTAVHSATMPVVASDHAGRRRSTCPVVRASCFTVCSGADS